MTGFQSACWNWAVNCFGLDWCEDRIERVDRFTEEAIELAQSLGHPEDRVVALVHYVYSRPKGEPQQEVGGTMVTLAVLCEAFGIHAEAAAEAELKRCVNNSDRIRKKQAEKPRGALCCHGELDRDATLRIIMEASAMPKQAREAGTVEDTPTQRDFETAYSNCCYLILRRLGLSNDEISDLRNEVLGANASGLQ